MSIKSYIDDITTEFEKLFSSVDTGMSAREDSRAFGAMVEKRITDNWQGICDNTNSKSVPHPGRRTIYDFASKYENLLFGFDVKTKDLDSNRYSDGGVCAVANLLRFLANEKAIFVVVEFGHSKSQQDNSLRDIQYIKLAPFHLLPADIYRIENLGTGQVRLNSNIYETYDKIEWDRPINKFFDIFVELAIAHYKRVGRTAEQRADAMRKFRDAGYNNF